MSVLDIEGEREGDIEGDIEAENTDQRRSFFGTCGTFNLGKEKAEASRSQFSFSEGFVRVTI